MRDLMGRKRTATCIKMIFGISLLITCSSLAQNNSDIERRLSELERKVQNMESRLDKALSPAKYQKTTPTPKPQQKVEVQRVSQTSTNRYTAPKTSTSTRYIPSPISAKLFQKSVKLSDADEVEDYITLLITFKNNDPKGIASFSGEIVFETSYGDSILSISADINKYIAPLKGKSWYGGISYDSADKAQRKLLDLKIHDISTEIRLTEIVFEDGTRRSIND